MPTITTKKLIGNSAEDLTCAFLEKNGLILIERNFNCRLGEVDLIMRDKDTIVFVEVRARNSTAYGHAIDSIDKTKQKKVIKAATFYLLKKKWLDKVYCRFDVVGVSSIQSSTENKETTELRWIKNAFILY